MNKVIAKPQSSRIQSSIVCIWTARCYMHALYLLSITLSQYGSNYLQLQTPNLATWIGYWTMV